MGSHRRGSEKLCVGGGGVDGERGCCCWALKEAGLPSFVCYQKFSGAILSHQKEGVSMNTAAKWPCVTANKSQKPEAECKKKRRKAFLCVKIYLGLPVLPFSFLFKQIFPPVSLILHMFQA